MTALPRPVLRSCFLAFTATALAACGLLPQPSHQVTTETPQYEPATSSRIRLFSGNGTRSTSYIPNSACYKGWGQDKALVRADDGILAAWKYSSRSITIGMPPSPREYMRVDGLGFKDSIREYVVASGEPMVISMGIGGSAGNASWSCSPPRITFTPVAGHDYEAFLEMPGRRCWIAVREIDGHGLDAPVRVQAAQKCAATDAGAAADHAAK